MVSIAGPLNWLSKPGNGLYDIMAREFFGNNVPHMAVVRTHDEFVDQTMGQVANTATFFGSVWGLNKLYQKIGDKAFKAAKPAGKSWFILGKSLSALTVGATFMLAMPFLRNYITAKRTGTTNYTSVIGEAEKTSQRETKEYKKLTKDYLNTFATRMGIGIAASLGLFGLTVAATKRASKFAGKTGLWKAPEFIQKKIGFDNGKATGLKNWAAFFAWTIPTYLGFVQASRDKFEIKELALRFVGFNLAFFILPLTVERFFDKAFAKTKNKFFGNGRNIAYAAKFVTSTVLCSLVPTVLNIYLTHQRVLKENKKKAAAETEAKTLSTAQPNATKTAPKNTAGSTINHHTSDSVRLLKPSRPVIKTSNYPTLPTHNYVKPTYIKAFSPQAFTQFKQPATFQPQPKTITNIHRNVRFSYPALPTQTFNNQPINLNWPQWQQQQKTIASGLVN